jgi:cytochrome c biogenesis protein CcdA
MSASGQRYQAHRRFLRPYHFFVLPVLVLNVVVELLRLYRTQTLYHVWMVVVAGALVALALMARLMALTVQTRVIRLEERLRLQQLMPAEEHAAIAALGLGQIVGLRFASDEEAPALARRCAAGELRSSGEVKRQIRNWRADHLRV